jgi:hypothetical protein
MLVTVPSIRCARSNNGEDLLAIGTDSLAVLSTRQCCTKWGQIASLPPNRRLRSLGAPSQCTMHRPRSPWRCKPRSSEYGPRCAALLPTGRAERRDRDGAGEEGRRDGHGGGIGPVRGPDVLAEPSAIQALRPAMPSQQVAQAVPGPCVIRDAFNKHNSVRCHTSCLALAGSPLCHWGGRVCPWHWLHWTSRRT